MNLSNDRAVAPGHLIRLTLPDLGGGGDRPDM